MAFLELLSTFVNARWIFLVAVSYGLLKLYQGYIRVIHDENEPPLIKQPFPVVGHLMGMLRDGSNYYTQVSANTKHPIYTLALPGTKVYVVSSPHLAALVDKNPRSISFAPFMILFIKRIMVVSQKAIDALSQNVEGVGHWGFREETMKMVHATMAHGDNLEKITKEMLRSLIPQLAISRAGSVPRKEELFTWMKKIATRASTDAIYGDGNPFHDPRVEDGFWDLNAQFALLGLNIMPQWIARKGNRGRDTFFKAFNKYYENKRHQEASPLAQGRYNMDRKYDITIDDTARFEISMCEGLLVNIVPSAFWCMFFVYRRPALLEEFRVGLDKFVEKHTDETTGRATHSVDFKAILASYPLLAAVLKEVLRLLSTNASGRVLLKDTILDNKYLLKKDAVLLVPSAEMHNDPTVWGADWAEFNPYRWLKTDTEKVPLSAYRAFGGGSWPCPGRLFSLNEIGAALVMVILQYDLVPLGGEWKQVKTSFHINTSVLTPKEDIEVEVRPRHGTENVDWRFYWEGVEIE